MTGIVSIVSYLWPGDRAFSPAYVNVLARAVKHHLPQAHRFVCVCAGPVDGFSDDVDAISMPAAARALLELNSPEGPKFPSSYPRLWTFSAEAAGILGERVLLLDVDCLIAGDMRPLFRVPDDFVGWRVRPPPGAPRRFGGGTWLLRTGTRRHVWEDFVSDPARAISTARAAGYRGSDQAWISYCLSEREASWPEPSGIYCAQDYRRQPRTPRLSAQRHRHRRFNAPRDVPPPPPRAPLQVPPGAIILHMNGAEKPWSTDDELVRGLWRPFLAANEAPC